MTAYNQDHEAQRALLKEIPRILMIRSGAFSFLALTGVVLWLWKPDAVPIVPIVILWMADLFINIPYYLLFKKLGPCPAWQYRLRLAASSLEILMVTVVIHYLGGVSVSILTFGYAMFVMFAATAYPRQGTVVLGLVSAVTYSGLVALEYWEIVPPVGVRNIHLDAMQQVTVVVLNLVLIAIVGYVATAFAERLTQRTQSLEKALDELQSTQEQLVEASRLASIGKLSAEVAHEINNPVGVILGFAQATSKGLTEKDPMHLPLTSIEREARRVRSIVQNLLNFARSSQWTPRQTNVNQVLVNTMILIGRQVSLQSVEIVENYASDLPLIMADESQLHQLFLNLILNAVQAMPEGGQLTLQSALADNMVKVTIEDTGVGFSAEYTSHIFDPFSTIKDLGRGTGLGLAVSRAIVQRHQGRIEVESAPDQGTSFHVYLPVKVAL